MYLLVILGMVLSVAADGPDDAADAAAKVELTKLDGTWVVESILRDPREKYPDEGKGIQCVIKEGKVLAKAPGKDQPSPGGLAIKIHPAKTPKAMDLQSEGGKDVILAIYELEGDILRVCWGPLEKPRPTEFASKPGSGHSLVVLKREKP
jgi:uncharacterized protein (TIGR03067 family)